MMADFSVPGEGIAVYRVVLNQRQQYQKDGHYQVCDVVSWVVENLEGYL